MRRLVLTLGSLALTTVGSLAADMGLSSENFDSRWSWSGFHVGATVGYGWMNDQTRNPATGAQIAEAEGKGETFGVFAGYNHQFGSFVGGVELEYIYQDNAFTDGSGVVFDNSIALKARGGVAIDRILLYGVAGFVHADTSSPGDFAGSEWGNVFGAGVDVMVTENIFAGVEYNHQRFEDFNDLPIDAQVDLVNLRVAYKF